MKKISKALLFIAVPAVAAVSCAKENIVAPNSGETRTVTFNVAEVETKTVFGEKDGSSYPTLWTTNEQVAVSYNGEAVMSADVTPSSDGKTASFTLEIEKDATSTHKFFAVSPAASVTDTDKEDNSFYIYLPTVQTSLASSCEEKAQVLAASCEYPAENFDNQVELNFKHIFAYGNMSVSLPSDAGTIESVSLTATGKDVLSGHFNYSFENDELLDLDAKTNIVVKTDKADGIYFAVAPIDLSDKSLTVTVTTDKGVYAKTIDLSGKTLKFIAGQVSKFSVSGFTQSEARSEAWTLVTDASTLAVGDKLVIASNGDKKVASDISDSVMGEVSADFTSDNLQITKLDASTVILTLGGSADAWTLANSAGELLGATAVKKLAWNAGSKTWKISVDNKTNNATIQNTTTSYGRFLHNTQSDRLTTYTSSTTVSMLLPQLYRLSSCSALVAPANLNAVVDGQTVTVTWDTVSGAKDYTVTCTGQTEQTVSGTSCKFENLEYDTEYTISAVANPEDSSVSKSAASTTTVKTGENPNPYLTVTPSEYNDEIPAAGDVLTFTVKTNQSSWTVSSSDETNFKTSIAEDNTGFTVTVAANEGEARSATITVSAEEKVFSVDLNQKEKNSTQPIIVSVDFTKSSTFPSDFPTDNKSTTKSYTLICDEYSFVINCNTSMYRTGTKEGNYALLFGKAGTTDGTASTILLPSVDNMKLSSVSITTPSGVSTNVMATIREANVDEIVTGGEEWTFVAATTKTFTLSKTKNNTAYRIYILGKKAKGYNAQISKIELHYEY